MDVDDIWYGLMSMVVYLKIDIDGNDGIDFKAYERTHVEAVRSGTVQSCLYRLLLTCLSSF